MCRLQHWIHLPVFFFILFYVVLFCLAFFYFFNYACTDAYCFIYFIYIDMFVFFKRCISMFKWRGYPCLYYKNVAFLSF